VLLIVVNKLFSVTHYVVLYSNIYLILFFFEIIGKLNRLILFVRKDINYQRQSMFDCGIDQLFLFDLLIQKGFFRVFFSFTSIQL
jgi:hypothetical protein